VCCRLFERRSHPPLPLKRLSMAQVEDFRQHGYVVLDGLLTRDAAARLKAEAGRAAQRGAYVCVWGGGGELACRAGAMSPQGLLLMRTRRAWRPGMRSGRAWLLTTSTAHAHCARPPQA
jgi:hypothetical protein